MFDQMLLAIDGSPAGTVATDFAAALARRFVASIHVVYVNEQLPGRRHLTLLPADEALDIVETAMTHLARAGVCAEGSVHVARRREIPSRIVAVAGEEGAEAIVVGSRRAHRLSERMFANRVRDRIMRQTALPVVVAPTPLDVDRISPCSWTPWTREDPMRSR